MAKADYSRVEALKLAWQKATLIERELFVIELGRESHAIIEAATKSLFSQHHADDIQDTEDDSAA